MGVPLLPSDPWYYNWTFWTAVIALAALVLSQFPPLYGLLRPGRLGGELYSRVVLQHKLGNPNARVNVILERWRATG